MWSFKARCGAIAAGYTQPGSRVVSLENSSQHRNNQPAQRDPALLRFSPETLTIDLAKVVSARLYIIYCIFYMQYIYCRYIHIILYYTCMDHGHMWNKYIQRLHFYREKPSFSKATTPESTCTAWKLNGEVIGWFVDQTWRWNASNTKVYLTCRTFVWMMKHFTYFFYLKKNVIWCPTHQVYFNLGFKTVQAKDL